MALNLEKQLSFYGAYHHDPINVGIHIVCVPAILITTFLLLTNTPSIPLPDNLEVPNFPANAGTIACLVYSGFYILLEPVAGSMLAPLLIGATAFSNHLTTTYGSTANTFAIGINVASWIAQFVGHGIFEGRAPALLDNLVQAIVLAPFFVWLEVLFMFGYRPELKSRLDKTVANDVAKFKASKAKKTENGHANSAPMLK